MTKEEELEILRRKLAARRNVRGFEESVKAIERRIAELEAG